MNESKVIRGFYGSPPTSCDVLCYGGWYCVRGSKNVNYTLEDYLIDDVNTEALPDYDYFCWDEPINSLDELVKAVEE